MVSKVKQSVIIVQAASVGERGHFTFCSSAPKVDDATIHEIVAQARKNEDGENYVAVSREVTQTDTGRTAYEYVIYSSPLVSKADIKEIRRFHDVLRNKLPAIASLSTNFDHDQQILTRVVRLESLNAWLHDFEPALSAPFTQPDAIWRRPLFVRSMVVSLFLIVIVAGCAGYQFVRRESKTEEIKILYNDIKTACFSSGDQSMDENNTIAAEQAIIKSNQNVVEFWTSKNKNIQTLMIPAIKDEALNKEFRELITPYINSKSNSGVKIAIESACKLNEALDQVSQTFKTSYEDAKLIAGLLGKEAGEKPKTLELRKAADAVMAAHSELERFLSDPSVPGPALSQKDIALTSALMKPSADLDFALRILSNSNTKDAILSDLEKEIGKERWTTDLRRGANLFLDGLKNLSSHKSRLSEMLGRRAL